MRLAKSFGLLSSVVLVLAACGPEKRGGNLGDDDGVDANGPDCVVGHHRCNGNSYEVCTSGAWATQQECESTCSEELGCVDCIPGGPVCSEGNVHACTPSGEVGEQTTECTGSTVCQSGGCVDACAVAAESRSYTGCEYWAVDLDNAMDIRSLPSGGVCPGGQAGVLRTLPFICMNAGNTAQAGQCDPPTNSCPSGYTCQPNVAVCTLDAQHAPYAIVVSNPQARAVDVTVTGPEGTTFTATIPAGDVQALLPQMRGIPDQSIDNGSLAKKAYKVTSTLPIVAYQFNPLDNVDVFSNDASLLVPRAAFDTDYYVMAKPSLNRRTTPPGKEPFAGYASIVAWQDGTVVEVTPSTPVYVGTTIYPAGTAATFTLNAFDVLSLNATSTGDITGTKVHTTTGTVGVFGGHEASGFGEDQAPPDFIFGGNGPCCADHLEEMLFPTSTWGKTFAIARSQARETNEKDVLRIIAQNPNTGLTFTPAPSGGACPATLGPGAFCEIRITGDTAITATEPIMVAHYLQSAIWQDAFFGDIVGEGDPSMAIAVPTEQYRKDYTVLVPQQYAKNFLSISAGMTGAVFVDGSSVTLAPFASTYRSARVMVAAGRHTVTCPDGCGVLVYGYGDAVSYMFAGGLDLKQIVIQ